MLITKKFTHLLPDQPYKQTASKNTTVECTYEGPKYLLLRLHEQTGVIRCVERYGADKAELEASIVDDGHDWDFVVLDAEANTWEAAYLTGSYTHGEVADYSETLPSGGKYEFVYPDGCGVIGSCHAIEGLKYDKNLNIYTKPKFISHPINPVDFWQGVTAQKEEFDRLVSGDLSKFSDEQIAEIRAYHEFLKTAATTYQGIDHWKLAWPKFPDMRNN
jgi:hypothetical protein